MSKPGAEEFRERKPSNSYSLLQMKISEVQKSKKLATSTAKNNNLSSLDAKNSNSVKMSSKKEPEKEQKVSGKDPNVPDRSFGDYFCRICDSHMNSDAMWFAHVTGKRHLKNVKKGDTDSKYEELDEESCVNNEVKKIKDPIIGLSYIHEIRRREMGVPPYYNCFLCHASIATVPLVIEHVCSLKHRLNYIREHNSYKYELINATDLKKGHMESLAHDACRELEEVHGRGAVQVKQEKLKPQFPYKRSYNYSDDEHDDDDRNNKPFKAQKFNDKKDTHVGKHKDAVKRDSIRKSFMNDNAKVTSKEKKIYYSDEEEDYKRDCIIREKRTPERDSRSSRLESDSYFRQKSEIDSYSKHKDSGEYPRRDTHSRDVYYRSPECDSRNMYSRSPPAQKVPPPREDRMYGPHPKQISANNELLSECRSNRQTDPSVVFKDFVRTISSLPTDMFLKIVLLKLEHTEIEGLDEVQLLSKVMNKIQSIICNKLPSDIQAKLKERMCYAENTKELLNRIPSSASPQQKAPANPQCGPSSEMTYKPAQAPKFDISAINELIFGARQDSNSYTAIPPVNTHYTGNQQPHSSYQSSPATLSQQNYMPYSTNEPLTQTIPGLSLAENENPRRNEYQSHYSWNNPQSIYPEYKY